MPSVLSTLHILNPCLLASDRVFFYREDKPEFCTMGHICFWIISCHFNKLFNVVLDYVLFKKSLENFIIAKYSKVIMNFFQNSVLTSISVNFFLILPLFSLPFCCISDIFWYQYPFNWGKYCQFEQSGNFLWIYWQMILT